MVQGHEERVEPIACPLLARRTANSEHRAARVQQDDHIGEVDDPLQIEEILVETRRSAEIADADRDMAEAFDLHVVLLAGPRTDMPDRTWFWRSAHVWNHVFRGYVPSRGRLDQTTGLGSRPCAPSRSCSRISATTRPSSSASVISQPRPSSPTTAGWCAARSVELVVPRSRRKATASMSSSKPPATRFNAGCRSFGKPSATLTRALTGRCA